MDFAVPANYILIIQEREVAITWTMLKNIES